jgi:DNA-binding transcriptional LysR family regulator
MKGIGQQESRMELRHLKYFVAVAEHLHFGNAAKSLRIAQPVLSRHIQQLELETKVKLFERTRRSVTITHAGAIFLTSARQILSQTEVALDATRRAAAGKLGSLRISCGPVTTYSVLPGVLDVIKRRLPGVDLHVSHATTSEQIASLRSNDIDVAFVVPPMETSGLRTRIMLEESLVAVVPRGHRLSKMKKVGLLDLKDEQFVFPLRPKNKAGLYSVLENVCRRAGFTPRVAHEAYPIQTLLALVGSGFGISLVPESVQRFMKAQTVFIPIQDTVGIKFLMAWRSVETSPVVSAFVDSVAEALGKRRRHDRFKRQNA